ncbi:MAG: cytochrome c1 [Pseudomonadales bacterium]
MGFWKTVGAFLSVAALTILPLKAVGSEAAFDCGSMACDHIEVDANNQASLQSGAKMYMNYCMGCHALQYARYERTANDMGVPIELFNGNLKFEGMSGQIAGAAKIGDLMENAMSEDMAKRWFGAAPPDLTLVARARGTNWLYTYLRNFHADPSRPYGVNNKVFKDVGMPHVLLELQGMTECAPGPVHAANGGIKRDEQTGKEELFGEDGKAHNPCGRLAIVEAGKMNPQEYDQAVYDLVNFLAYVAEPMAEDRKRIGIYVLLFIALFFVFTYLLNREYWKDVH